jgi:hypothetical protein
VSQLIEVRRIERLSETLVRLTAVPVAGEGPARPYSEHHLDVPVAEEVPTGTRFEVSYTVHEGGE